MAAALGACSKSEQEQAQRQVDQAATQAAEAGRELKADAQEAGRELKAEAQQAGREAAEAGQREPGVAFRRQAPGDVERAAQLGAEAPHHRRARQGVHIAPGAAAQPREQGQVRLRGRERGQRQRGGPVGRQRLPARAQAQQGDCYQSSSCLRLLHNGWRRI